MRLLALAFIVVLVSCAPTSLDRSSLSNAQVISGFAPDKPLEVSRNRQKSGKSAPRYRVGEQVRFDFMLAKGGYATLISYGPTGNTTPLESNVLLNGGKHVFPRPEDRQGNAQAAYVVGAPTGNNRVILIFSSSPLQNIPRGRLDARQLETAISASLSSSNLQVVDVAETAIEVTP
jgi:hypothetical protein